MGSLAHPSSTLHRFIIQFIEIQVHCWHICICTFILLHVIKHLYHTRVILFRYFGSRILSQTQLICTHLQGLQLCFVCLQRYGLLNHQLLSVILCSLDARGIYGCPQDLFGANILINFLISNITAV